MLPPKLDDMSTNDRWDTPLSWTYPPAAAGGTDLMHNSAPTGAVPQSDAPTYGPNVGWPYGGEPPNGPAQPPLPPSPPRGDWSPRPPRPQPAWGRKVAAGVVLVAVAVGSGVTGALVVGDDGGAKTVVQSAPQVNVQGGTAPAESLAKVAAAVSPSVVSIAVQAGQGGDTGSGIILRSNGTIVTNNHVVAAAANGAGSITVKFSDGSTAGASIVGRDPGTDLAVIQAKGVSGKKPITLGAINSVHVGDTVLAIGSPLGLEGSVTSGIVSALHRTVVLGSETGGPSASVGDAIQTDAAINPGNSGGALVDAQGRLIGINSAIASLSSGSGQSGSIGVGFAIPVDEVKSVSNQLMNGETPKHALLGVQINDDPNGGALIADVNAGSAAARGGLQVGDVITKVDGTSIADGTSLSAVIRSHQPGDKVAITYTRNGTQHQTTVTLGSATG